MPRLEGDQWAVVYAVLGIAITAFAVFHLVVEGHERLTHQLVYAGISLSASAAILYHAHRHRREPFPAARYPRLNAWVLVMALLLGLVGVASLYVGSQLVEPTEIAEATQLLLHVGLALGLHLGTVEARALENAADAARSRTLAAEREHRELLLGLLRHYVLNGLTVIEGYADRLTEDLEAPRREWARTIRHRADTTAEVMDVAGLLLRSETEAAPLRSAAVGEDLRRECERAAPETLTVAAESEFPTVRAHADYETAIELLVTGLLQATEPDGRIAIDGAGATITITAQPAHAPAHLRAELEEPIGSDVGLPLFLAKELFAPAIELDVRTTDGDTLVVDLVCESVGDSEHPGE